MNGPELYSDDLETVARYLQRMAHIMNTLKVGVSTHTIFVGDASLEVEVSMNDDGSSFFARVVA